MLPPPNSLSLPSANLTLDTRLLRLGEVKKRLKVSNTTVHEFWKESSPYYKKDMPKKFYIGRTPYVRECELEAFILSNMQNTRPTA
jgi:predicted DNA-binding transcriptional regulator AlpA